MSIIISEPEAGTTRLEPRPIPKETLLQDYVQDHPEVLPMNEIREDIQLFVAAKEFTTPSGSIDILALDQEGEIYIIETKLYKNPDKRTVLAQAMDYGAALWRQYSAGGQFVTDLADAFRNLTGASLEEDLAERLGAEDDEVEVILEAIGENIRDGAFHFVVLMDRMDDRLKDLIAFVNENSRFSVYGVELDFYEHEELEIVIPRMYGAEVRKEVATSRSGRRAWDEQSFFEDAAGRLPEAQVEAIRALYAYCQRKSEGPDWGTGTKWGSFNPKFAAVSESKSVITVKSDGRLMLNFGWLGDSASAKRFVSEFGPLVEKALGIKLPPNHEEQYPQYKADVWAEKVEELVDAIDSSLRLVEGRG